MIGVRPLGIDGAWLFSPQLHRDDRGVFLEVFQKDRFAEAVGHDFVVAQVNTSVSARGTLRGIHFADVPPGQAKYVTCIAGAILDVVVDVRVGSPTFGQWESVRLDDQERQAVYLAEGLGHAFIALTDGATVSYLCSEPYRQRSERGVDPLDADLAISWPQDLNVRLSPKDATAPSLQVARSTGLLPDYGACVDLYRSLVSGRHA